MAWKNRKSRSSVRIGQQWQRLRRCVGQLLDLRCTAAQPELPRPDTCAKIIVFWHGNGNMAMSIPRARVRLGPQGRLVVPAPIRKALGFQPGDRLVACVDNERLVVEKSDVVERRLRAYFRKFKGRSLADELIAERREEARRETP